MAQEWKGFTHHFLARKLKGVINAKKKNVGTEASLQYDQSLVMDENSPHKDVKDIGNLTNTSFMGGNKHC